MEPGSILIELQRKRFLSQKKNLTVIAKIMIAIFWNDPVRIAIQ